MISFNSYIYISAIFRDSHLGEGELLITVFVAGSEKKGIFNLPKVEIKINFRPQIFWLWNG